MTPKIELPDPSHLLELHKSGMSVQQLADKFGVSCCPIYNRIKGLPGYVPHSGGSKRGSYRAVADSAKVISLYQQGMSEIAVAKELGITRMVVRTRLVNAGVHIRDRSEALRNRWRQVSESDRRRLMERVFENSGHISRDDVEMFAELTKHGIACKLNHPVPIRQHWPYRIDVAILEPLRIAVEIQRSGWSVKRRPYISERAKYILNGGWFMVYVLLQNRPTALDVCKVRKYLCSLLDASGLHDSLIGKYTVIGGDAKNVSRIGFDLDGCTFIERPEG